MKKLFVVLTLAAVLSFSSFTTLAFADSCMCVRNSGCGSGGIGGNFLRLSAKISTNDLKYYLVNPAALATFTSTGQVYDAGTGWFCCKGCMP